MGGKSLLVILGAGTFSPWEERPATQIYFVAATQRGNVDAISAEPTFETRSAMRQM